MYLLIQLLCFFIFIIHNHIIVPWHAPLITLDQIQQLTSDCIIIPCKDAFNFKFTPLPVTNDHYLHPYEGTFINTFIAKIPQAQAYGVNGDIIFNNKQIYDFVWQNCFIPHYEFEKISTLPITHIKGTVAVIAQSGYSYYFHWLLEILGRLALLELHNIHYDYLYVPTHIPYMQQTLELWGIDFNKIIPATQTTLINAEDLVIPSLISKVQTNGCPRLAHYIPEYIVNYVKNKLQKNSKKQLPTKKFNTKVFISRQDANARRIINEDQVFELLKQKGFSRYKLTELSVQEQIALFNQAHIIIGTMGSGFSNIIFCNQNVKIIDIMQARKDGTIYYLCQTLNIPYHCYKTMDFICENDGQYDTNLPLDIINNIIQAEL